MKKHELPPYLSIDHETADRITVNNLTEYRNSLRKELELFENGEYLHPEDVIGNMKRIQALDLIINDFSS